jgi:hypothetical protein
VSKNRNVNIALPFNADNRTEAVIYNMRGQKVFSHAIKPGSREVSMKIPGTIARGTYIVNIRDESGKNRAADRIQLR